MVIWHGILQIKHGQRDVYIKEIQKAEFKKIFEKQEGYVFYSIGKDIDDEDKLIICDGWKDKKAFVGHDTSKAVDHWRELYDKYVEDCVSNLYEI